MADIETDQLDPNTGLIAKLKHLVIWLWNIRLGPAVAIVAAICLTFLCLWSVWTFFHDPGGRQFVDDGERVPTIVELDAKKTFSYFQSELDSTKEPFFDPVTVSLARLCGGIYGDEVTTVPRAFFDLRFDEIEPAVTGSQAALIGRKEDVVVVVFRGTNEIKDWYFNLDVGSQPCDHGSMHRGFWDAYSRVREGVIEKLKESKPKHIWITGHSLGGAMAMCCAYDLEANEGMKVSGLVTFGQPKLADSGVAEYFATGLSGRYLAFINDRDPVCEPAPNCYPCGVGVWLNGNSIELADFKDALPRYGGVGSTAIPTSTSDDSTEYLFKMMPEDVWKQKLESIPNEGRPSVAGLPPRAQRVGSPWKSLIRLELPYISDHSMKRYISKLERHHFGVRTMAAPSAGHGEELDKDLLDASINY